MFLLGLLMAFVGPLATAEPSEAMLTWLIAESEAKMEMKLARKMEGKLETAIREATDTMRVDMQGQIDGTAAKLTEFIKSRFEQLTSHSHRRLQTTGILFIRRAIVNTPWLI